MAGVLANGVAVVLGELETESWLPASELDNDGGFEIVGSLLGATTVVVLVVGMGVAMRGTLEAAGAAEVGVSGTGGGWKG